MRKIILIGTMPPPYHGQSIAFQILARYFANKDIPYNIINVSGSKPSSIKLVRLLIRSLEYIIVFIKLFKSSLFSKNIVYVQVSQSKNGFYRDVWINRISNLSDSIIIAHLHGGNFNGFYESQNAQLKDSIKQELLNYSRIIILSNNLKSMYDFQPEIRERIVCVPNGIGKLTDRPEKKLTSGKPIHILYLSNLIESKGYLLVLESLFHLKKAGIPFVASFCGQFDISDGQSDFSNLNEAKRNFLKNVTNYNLENEVTYKGVVIGVEKDRLLDEAHFFILPTQYIYEGQPISIIEAMRTGCVVISSNYRAIPEMIINGKTGFLLDVISAKEIANCIITCLENVELFGTLSKNAIDYYNENFTEAVHVQRMVSILQEYRNTPKSQPARPN